MHLLLQRGLPARSGLASHEGDRVGVIFHPEEMSSTAASSPVSSTKIGDTIGAISAINANTTPQHSVNLEMPKQSLRGLNKPKCIKCGNVARSRCPFQSCKSCCSKAENPCYIHVLKQNSTLPDKPLPINIPSVEQPSNDLPSNGASWRLNLLKQLSTHFANSLRTKKPLSKKDAISINKWRFTKLREHIQGNIEAETEAFDRYIGNVHLLEEVFSIADRQKSETKSAVESGPSEDEKLKSVCDIKINLKVNTEQAEHCKQRTRNFINQKLSRLREREIVVDDGFSQDNDHRALKRSRKIVKSRLERNAAMDELIDKLNRARNQEDLKSCLDMKLQLSNLSNNAIELVDDLTTEKHLITKKEPEDVPDLSLWSVPKMCKCVHIDQNALSNINEFSSLGEIAEL